MKFIDVKTAKVDFGETVLAQLKDGSYALAQLESIQADGKTFKCGDIHSTEPWNTNGVVAIAKLPRVGKPADQKDPAI